MRFIKMQEYIKENIRESVDCKARLLESDSLICKIEEVARLCIDIYKKGNKILTCGNGGSASDAQHLVGELVGRYMLERNGIPAIALTANSTVMTALANDYDYESVFSKQVKAYGNKGDVLIGISTSGNSQNVIKAFEKAREMGIITVGFTGEKGGNMKTVSDYLINVPSDSTPRIQEMHILVIHIICGLIEGGLFE
jgi:D-sedoheptulose 7-phosphate isomerase